MAKRVQLVLNQNVSKLGREGDLVEVAPGYARNYLLPQKIGSLATPSILKQVELRKEKERQRLIAEKEAIFGTVTAQELADAIKASTGQEVDRRGITIPEIGKTGFYKAQVKLHPEVSAEVEIQVTPL
jgi:large subunit ribosomal protein L9